MWQPGQRELAFWGRRQQEVSLSSVSSEGAARQQAPQK
jgi:hypothetical protein